MNKLPTLYHQGKKGKIFSWRVWTEGPNVLTEYGPDDGKKQFASKAAKPKNAGRSNATTAEQQAEREAQSMWQAKLDRKYRKTIEEAQEPLPLPMLAKSFDKEKKKVVYPCDVQPKFDGVRCLAQWEGDHVELTSRSGKPYDCPHIKAELELILPKGIILDGEIYVHGETFQEVTRLVKKVRDDSIRLQLWVYDIIDTSDMDLPWAERREKLDDFFKDKEFATLIHVASYEVADDSEVQDYEKKFVGDGYEGAIVRLRHGVYRWGYRSDALLKVKTFQDDEFPIVGFKPGIGKFSDACIWLCKTPEGKEFEVVSKGTMEYRRQLLKEAEQHVGKLMKVKYFEKTESGIPRFPVGLGFRLEEDL